MAKIKYPKIARAIATEFTPAQIGTLLQSFGRGVDPRAIGDACGNGCGSGCGNSCRRAVGFVFDEFGYVNPSATELRNAAGDLVGLRRSIEAQIAVFLR